MQFPDSIYLKILENFLKNNWIRKASIMLENPVRNATYIQIFLGF